MTAAALELSQVRSVTQCLDSASVKPALLVSLADDAINAKSITSIYNPAALVPGSNPDKRLLLNN